MPIIRLGSASNALIYCEGREETLAYHFTGGIYWKLLLRMLTKTAQKSFFLKQANKFCGEIDILINRAFPLAHLTLLASSPLKRWKMRKGKQFLLPCRNQDKRS